MGILETIIDFIDNIFKPPISFLDMAIEKIANIQMVTAQGIDLSAYFSIFGDMPTEWQMVVSSLLASTVLLTTLIGIKAILRLYFALKEGVKWW